MRGAVARPALLIVFIAPFMGESLSGATPPLELVLPWNLAFMAALYGCGALVCREVAHRFGLGFGGLILLGVAYGIWEEGLVDRYWFFPKFWDDSGVGTYGVVGQTNVLLALHLTTFHAAISICSSILIVERLRPAWRHRCWVSRPTLAVASVVLAATPLIYGEFDQRPSVPALVATATVLVAVVVAAFGMRKWISADTQDDDDRPPTRWLGVLAFACISAHWIATYSVASAGISWPAGVAFAMLPVAIGLVLVPRLAVTGPLERDGGRVVAGLLCFFAVLDGVLGLLGRYDMFLSAALAIVAAVWLYRRRPMIIRSASQPPREP